MRAFHFACWFSMGFFNGNTAIALLESDYIWAFFCIAATVASLALTTLKTNEGCSHER